MRAPHSCLAPVLAIACLLAAACNDTVPTSPGRGLLPQQLNADRSTPTFVFDTIDVPGAVATTPQGINAAGVIVGFYSDAAKHTHGFLWRDGTVTAIDYHTDDNTFVADNTDARGIGPDGTIVGAHWNTGEEAVAAHGYRRNPNDQFSPVHFDGHLYEFPQRILADGTILGCRHDHNTMDSMRGTVIRGDMQTEFTDMFASMNNGATPDGRLIVGLYTNMMVTPSRGEAYVIDHGDTTMFIVPGSTFTAAWDVNQQGDIVGVYRDTKNVPHGFVRTAAGYTTVDVPGAANTRAFGTNARGDVVGAFVGGGVTHGFLARRVK